MRVVIMGLGSRNQQGSIWQSNAGSGALQWVGNSHLLGLYFPGD